MQHNTPQFYPDPYNNGQETVARIRMEISEREMANAAEDAFSTGYVNPLWRAAKRRIFERNRADYERAKAILEALKQ